MQIAKIVGFGGISGNGRHHIAVIPTHVMADNSKVLTKYRQLQND
jgi:hypothetical protein